MSLPNRPGYQKQTKLSSSTSSSSSSTAGGGGGAPGARWNGNYSAGVSPVRGLSPVRGTFHGVVGRQDMEMARSHTNPLFNSRNSDIGRGGGVHTTPTKACKECKENRDKLQEPWKVPTDKAQYSGKTLNSSTPTGKSTRTTATMRFTTPPKPVVKRKILAENREFITTTCPPTRMKEEEMIKPQAAVAIAPSARPAPPRKEVMSGAEPPPIAAAVSQSRNDENRIMAESDGPSLSSTLSPEQSTTTTRDDPSKPKSPLVSIEELQKRIQKFLQDEGEATSAGADVSVPMMLCSPRQSTESLRRSLSGTFTGAAGCGEESSNSLTGFVNEAPFQPVVAPYSPRPESLRARKSPLMDGNVVSPLRGEGESLLTQEKTTTNTPNSAYDPKNNFLSPRPQFLRYKPLRRLELLRKSAEGTLGDLDLESPATDAGSSRTGSEKDVDERELVSESESQDVSQQDVQSLKSSSSLESGLESPPPRCKLSSHELFKSAPLAAEEGNSEITQLNTREDPEQQQQSSISSTKPPPQADDPSTDSEFDYLKGEEEEHLDEEDAEDANDNDSTTWYYNASRIVTIFAFVALLVVASGSPALLPTSLHQSHISHLWRTGKATEPIRQFLQTTEGLWDDNPRLRRDVSLPSLDIVHVGWVNVYSLIQSHVDLVKVVENNNVVWSFCMEYSARFGRLMKESYTNLKASLEREMNHSSRHGQEEVNEWDWVPEYEFVVPQDMFDPVEAYENIMARVESWEVKSFWSSLVTFSARHTSRKQIVEDPLDSTIEGWNASLCSLISARPADHDVILPTALGRVVADIAILRPSQDTEPTLDIPEQTEEENPTQELNAVQSVQNDHQEIVVGSVVVTQHSIIPDVVGTADANASDAIIVEVEPFSSPVGKQIPLSQGVEGVQLYHDNVHEEVQLSARVTLDDPQLLEPVLSQETQPVPFQESLQGDSEAAAVTVPSSPKENDVDSSMPLGTKPMAPRLLVADELMMQALGFRTTAAILTSLLLAAGVALLVFRKMYTRSGNSRPAANLKASAAAQIFSKPSVESQFGETNEFYPIEGSPGSEFLGEDRSLAVHLSLDQVRQFSTPYPVSGGTPEQLLGKVTVEDSLEKSLKQVTDVGDSFQTRNVELPQESSSLGLFTTMVPVVHNEGTTRERVQLTPVRRSSRIRTRMQNSPCHFMHSPHLCNC